MWNTSRNLRKYCGTGGRLLIKPFWTVFMAYWSVKILKAHTRNVTLNVWKLTSLVCAASNYINCGWLSYNSPCVLLYMFYLLETSLRFCCHHYKPRAYSSILFIQIHASLFAVFLPRFQNNPFIRSSNSLSVLSRGVTPKALYSIHNRYNKGICYELKCKKINSEHISWSVRHQSSSRMSCARSWQLKERFKKLLWHLSDHW